VDISIVQGCVVDRHASLKIELTDDRWFLSTRRHSDSTAFTLRTTFPLSSDTVSDLRTQVRFSLHIPLPDGPMSTTPPMV
jgi:hypothetical protein